MSTNHVQVKAYSGSITSTAVDVDSNSCRFSLFDIGNNNAAVSYVQVFNLPAASVTVGTTAPLLSFEVPANSGRVIGVGIIQNLGGSGFSIAATTTRTGSTAPAATVDINILR